MVSRRTLITTAAVLVLSAACSKSDVSDNSSPSTSSAPTPAADLGPLRVAAAADLARAFEEVGAAFEKATGKKTTFSFGSTGLLSKQIQEGAPFDVFAAANVSYVDDLIKKGSVVADTKALYARGRIVLWTEKAGDKAPPKALGELTDARFTKIAIANPEHAPYGKAAQQALEKASLWETVKPKLVYGENVQQTLQFAQTGNADAAIVALSLAVGSDGDYLTIEEALHEPIDQALAVCEGSKQKDQAKAFATYVNSKEGREILRRFGFLLPGESLAKTL